jgi:hypothetical protein
MFAAIAIYVMSDNLSFFPFGQVRQSHADASGK